MTVSSTHACERSARRRRTRRTILPAVLLVLLGQVVLPHLHAVQAGAHATPSATHRVAGPRPATPVGIEHAALPSDREHSESRCPVCQTLAHAHDFLPATSRQPTLADASVAIRAPRHDARRAERITARAPRSPPLSA